MQRSKKWIQLWTQAYKGFQTQLEWIANSSQIDVCTCASEMLPPNEKGGATITIHLPKDINGVKNMCIFQDFPH